MKEAKSKIKENVFKFFVQAAIAIGLWVLGNYLYLAPWRPSYFGGRLSSFLYLLLFVTVTAFMIFAVSKIKGIVDVLSEIIALEIARRKRQTLYYAERVDNAIKPFLYLGMRTFTFILFSPILDWMSPVITAIVGGMIIVWSIIAVYQSVSALARAKGKAGPPMDLFDFLTKYIVGASTKPITEKQLDFAYQRAKDANAELDKLRQWKYSYLVLFMISVTVSYYLASTDLMSSVILYLNGHNWTTSFIIGLLFASILTFPLSIAALITLAKTVDPFTIAIVGAAGAAITDYILFKASRQAVAEIDRDLKRFHIKIPHISQKIANIVVPLIAGFIIASPIPDEIAVTLLGSVKFNPKHFLILSYVFNIIGILLIISASSVL